MQDFKERFSLDYLSRGKREAQSQAQALTSSAPSLPPGLEDALIAYGGKILSFLRDSPNNSLKLFDLASATGLRIDALLPVIRYMTEKKMVERTVEDSLGNDTYRLSEAGQKL